MIDFPCVIFAGGKSSRMGKDKALLPFASEPSLALFQYKRFKKHFKEVFISCKTKEKFDFSANFIEDKNEIFSPLEALNSVFDYLKKDFFAISVDTPFFSIEDFYKLFSHIEGKYDIILSRSPNNSHPLCAIYKKKASLKIKKMLKENNHKLHNLLKICDIKYVDFPNEKDFINLNYPKDYNFAKRILNG